jgi:hypothetical protein
MKTKSIFKLNMGRKKEGLVEGFLPESSILRSQLEGHWKIGLKKAFVEVIQKGGCTSP